MKVRATKLGYYGVLRPAGTEFDIAKKEDLGSWMEVIEQPKPEVDYKDQARELDIPLEEDGKKRSHFAVKADIKAALGEGA